MDRRRFIPGTAVGFACFLLVGCGGSGGGGSRPASANLASPVFPRCGVEGFSKPQVGRLNDPETRGRTWTINYTRVQPARTSAQTTTFLIVEFSPASPPGKVPQPRDVVIANRHVAFHSPDKRAPAFAASWKTSRARYTVIANGTDPTAIKRLIGCLP